MAKVLILTAAFGEGHNSAARGIHSAFERSTDGLQSEIHDLVLESYGSLAEFARKAYIGAINHAPKVWQKVYDLVDRTDMSSGKLGVLSRLAERIEQLLDDTQPVAIVSTYPVYAYLLERIWQKQPEKRVPVFTIVTDSISINRVWTKCASDWFLVANEETARVIEELGIERRSIKVTGFPVSPLFADFLEQSGKPPLQQPWKILYMVNSGKKHAPGLLAELLKREHLELTVAAGKDDQLKTDMEEVVANSGRTATILGWSTEMPRLMCGHHMLIGKAGGATVQEALAACCPMVITQVVPGQEEGNAQLVEQGGCGMIAGHEDHVPAAIDAALADDAQQLRQWMEAIRRLSRPRAALDIAALIADEVAAS